MQISGADRCAAHVDPDLLDVFISTARREGSVDLRGTRISHSLVERLTTGKDVFFQRFLATEAVFVEDVSFAGGRFTGDTNFDGASFRGSARFNQALFEAPARFHRTRFAQRANFTGARFTDEARFTGARFRSTATFDDAVFDNSLWFERCRVAGNLSLAGASVGRLARFDSTVVSGNVRFARAVLRGDASFEGCDFPAAVDFDGCAFAGITLFTEAVFGSVASFGGAEFARELRLSRARFRSDVSFGSAQFTGPVWLDGSKVAGSARFDACRFQNQCYLDGAAFQGGLWFPRAEFAEATDFGPVDAGPVLSLSHVVVQRRMRLQFSADRLVALGARFADGIAINAAAGEMVFDGTVFAGPSTVAAFAAGGGPAVAPRILSLRRVDLTNLTIVDLDISTCLFAGAHNLDKFKVEGVRAFSYSPASPKVSIRSRELSLLPLWTRRRVLAEERWWRASALRRTPAAVRRRWAAASTPVAPWVAEVTGNDAEILSATRLSTMYRAMRKSYEDAKNEPGAADFYYGEMEMRRRAETTPLVDRVIIFVYWLISGYGLRAWRAFSALVCVVLAHGIALTLWGFAGAPPSTGPNYVKGLLFALDVLLFNPDRSIQLTTLGTVLRLTMKVCGPVLLGLFLLTVRNRVKR